MPNVAERTSVLCSPNLDLPLQHSADPNARNDDGKTPTDLAKEKGHEQIIRKLVPAPNIYGTAPTTKD